MRAALLLTSALSSGCASRAAGRIPADEHLAPVAEARAPTEQPPTEQPPVELPPPPVEPPPPARPRLPWVNPDRCVMPCTYDPGPNLARVDKHGVPDPAGTFLVDASIQEPLRALVEAAHAAGHKVRIESAFRSYDDQLRVFRETKQVGRAARPGHSEHQLGTAVDFRMPTSAAIAWLAEHAGEQGFVLSYPDGKQRITGYRPEPWHVRFVGPQLVGELHADGLTLEELFRSRPDLGESGSCGDCPQELSRAACGDVTVAGRCDGSVLHWCYDGALASIDCAAFKQRCGRPRGSDLYDCVATSKR